MAGTVVNLNKFRKKKAKADKEQRAETNRRLHGRSTAERSQDAATDARAAADKARQEKKIDGAFLERDEPDLDET